MLMGDLIPETCEIISPPHSLTRPQKTRTHRAKSLLLHEPDKVHVVTVVSLCVDILVKERDPVPHVCRYFFWNDEDVCTSER